MAGYSFDEAAAIIASAQAGPLQTLAAEFRTLGENSMTGGRKLGTAATQVGAQHGDPYRNFEERLAPVAQWVGRIESQTTPAATGLDTAAKAILAAQATLAKWTAALNQGYASAPGRTPEGRAMLDAVKENQAAVELSTAVQAISAAYAAINPPAPGAAPVRARDGVTGGPGAGTPAGTTARAASTAGTAGPGRAGADGATPAGTGAAVGTAVGPQNGQYAGWVQDPATGNLIDPATGREVAPSGQFVDPITGQPFGDPSQYASRLEGLQGGVGATGGLLAPGGLGVSVAPLGGGGAGAGGIGGVGGVGGFAGLYGGVVPPSLVGNNPASAQLRQKAAQNLERKADTAQRFSALANGTAQQGQQQGHGYVPPMGGAGAPMAGGRGSRGSGRRLVSEPADVWGATGRGAEKEGRKPTGSGTEVVEDADVWGSSAPAGSGVLGS